MFTLSPDRWQEISPYLDQALSLPEPERAVWFESFQVERPDLASLLQELLNEHSTLAQEHFLEQGPIGPRNEPSLPGQTVGAYRLISPIGQGGMGSVWLAERSDGRFERRVAVKFLNFAVAAQGAERFKREGSILGRLSDPHIAELIDAGVTANREPYLVLEYVEGEHIDEYCDLHALDVGARVRLFLDVLGAVAQAHAHLVVHRDIKPSNVLVRNDGQVKLLDFGIAKLLADDTNPASATLLTLEGGGALTPQFAAPEQVTGGVITTATDVYALGVLLYVLLTGQHPAGSGPHSAADLVKAIVDTEPPRVSDVNASADADKIAAKRATTPENLRRQLRGDLDTILGKALKKNPAERYTSVTALADDLQRYFKHEPISARPDTVAYRAAKFVRRNRGTVVLTAVAFIAVMAGIAGTLIQARTARRQRDFAFRQLARAEKINDLNHFLLTDAEPGKPLSVDDLLEGAERIIKRENYSQDPAHHVEMLVSIGSQYCDKEEFEKALPILQEAYQLSRGLQDHSARAEASCALARPLYRELAQYARAESLIREGLRELPDDSQFASERASCLLTGGNVALWSNDGKEALIRQQSAERILNNSSFASNYLRISVLADLAEDYLGSGQVGKSIASYERASELVTNLGYGETETAAQLLHGRANALLRAGRPYEAERVLHRAIEIRTATGNLDNPILLNGYAEVLRQLGRLSEAASYAERGYAKAQGIKDKLIAEQSLEKLEQIYREQGDLKRASAMFAQVEPLIRRDWPAGDYQLTLLMSEQSLLAQAKGNLPGALQLADQALATDEAAINSGHVVGELLILPGLLVRRSGVELDAQQPERARADAERAVSLLLAQNGPGTFSIHTGRAYLALGRALQAQGKSDEARAAFRSAAEQLEHAGGANHPLAHTARQLAGLESQ